MFSGGYKPVIGLDIGADAVKMVGLRKNGKGYYVTMAAMSRIGEDVDGGEAGVVGAIRRCIESSGDCSVRNSYFVCGLSGSEVKVSTFGFMSLSHEEVAQAVRFEAEQVCSFDIRRGVVDYQFIGDDGKKKRKGKKGGDGEKGIRGVFAVATKDAIREKRQIAADALLKCALMDVDGLALLNGLLESGEVAGKLPAVIVNVGKSLSTIAILGSDGLPFIRDLAYSGDDIVNYIAKRRGIDRDKVEKMLCSGEGLPEDVRQELVRASKRLLKDIAETLTYYSIQKGTIKTDGVYVSGGYAMIREFVGVLQAGLEHRVMVWNPFTRIQCEGDVPGGELLSDYGPAMAVAAGLAMRSV